MPPIDNAQVKRFCNERVRVAADRLAQMKKWCEVVEDEWTAQNMGTLIPNTTDVIVDGSETDGRPQITGEDVHNLKDIVLDLITYFEANSDEKWNEVSRIAVNPSI